MSSKASLASSDDNERWCLREFPVSLSSDERFSKSGAGKLSILKSGRGLKFQQHDKTTTTK